MPQSREYGTAYKQEIFQGNVLGTDRNTYNIVDTQSTYCGHTCTVCNKKHGMWSHIWPHKQCIYMYM